MEMVVIPASMNSKATPAGDIRIIGRKGPDHAAMLIEPVAEGKPRVSVSRQSRHCFNGNSPNPLGQDGNTDGLNVE
jgi:hypothetical protein